MSLLSSEAFQEEFKLTEEERLFLDKELPKTMVVNKDNLKSIKCFLRGNKDDYVLKNSGLYGGLACHFLSELSLDNMKSLFLEIQKERANYILQKRIVGKKFPFILPDFDITKIKEFPLDNIRFREEQLSSVLGLFTVAGKYSSSYVRASSKLVISSGDGCITSAVYYKDGTVKL